MARDALQGVYPTDHSGVSVHSSRLDTAPLPVNSTADGKRWWVSTARRIEDPRTRSSRTGLRSMVLGARTSLRPGLAEPAGQAGQSCAASAGTGAGGAGGGRAVGPVSVLVWVLVLLARPRNAPD